MKKLLQTAILSSLLFGCEKALITEVPPDNISVFEDVYHQLDENYVYFEYKNIHWDSIYCSYRPRISNSLSDEAFYSILKTFVHELKDGHTRLQWNNRSSFYDFTHGANHNFNYALLASNYLKNDYLTSGKILYKKFGTIGYIYIPNFWNGDEHEKFDDILTYFADSKGLIIDIRDNGGGVNLPGRSIAGHFVTQKLLVEKWFCKNGPAHNDFSRLEDAYIETTGKVQFLKNIVLLVNRKVYSAANDFANIMNQLPQVKLIGDTTGGGGGIPRPYILSNGWILRFSDTFSLDAQGFNIENGIPPDIHAELDTTQTITDDILERALQELNTVLPVN